jgi:hypothetical protein
MTTRLLNLLISLDQFLFSLVTLEREHCWKSYEAERLGKQLPPEYQTIKAAR